MATWLQATFHCPPGQPNHYVEQLQRGPVRVGTYAIPAGSIDDQHPHEQDEVYVVVAGAGALTAGGKTAPVRAGSTVFVPAGEAHRFHDITADLTILVIFA